MLFTFIQHDIIWEEKAANHRHVDEMVARASVPAGAFVVLPELGDTGFSFHLDRIIDDLTLPWASNVARRYGIWLQAGFARRGEDGRGRNCSAIVAPDGSVQSIYEKIHPFSFGREIEHYGPGTHLSRVRAAEAVVTPFICYDLRFPELFRLAAMGGAEVFTIGASWPAPRQHHWRALMIARAIENQAFVVGVNRVGRDPTLEYAGGSIIVGPGGEVLAEAGERESVMTVDLDLAGLRAWRVRFPALCDIQASDLGSRPWEATR